MIRRWGIPVLALLGLAVAGYLSWTHLARASVICLGDSSSCDRVNASLYSQLAGIPVAYIGFAGYLALGAIGLYAARPRPGLSAWILAGWGISLVGVLFSAWLTYVELFILHEICQWCVVSAILQVLIFALYTWRLRSPGPG